ncbi:CheR family methyltransferase [Chryseolinea lacunae]|uniref:Protein-glutamate O-methyltransferase CheR n=1 Tax=Chryseolinea lacunae TaxID=2801331 RepID=A0ABS1KQY2_9BACT|nr:protein-glutamate O-methyltransferase CheR [Chryseolinea lacunae]MBL0741097.1 protein-glutamate O-methyltransferase CheR [Chryseolinea lacunae]
MITEVSDEEVNALLNSILVRYGIDFTCYEPKSLRRRIIRILNHFEFPSVQDLWIKFLRDSNFVNVFMNEVSVGMTSMFRDPILWTNLQTRLRQEFISRGAINTWHAGCSTGEEVYSFAIVLKESRLLHKAKAHATDFNRNALEEAQHGVYHKIKMLQNEANYREYNTTTNFHDYYTTDGKNATMDRKLVANTQFSYHNLITDSFSSGFDIIFCRNVMIYFDAPAKTKLLDKFHAALNPGGYLIIGFFDTITHLMDSQKFNLVDEQAKIFQKV